MSERKEKTPAERLFPLGKEYVLESGERVEVRKWSVETMMRVSQRVPEVLEKFLAMPKDQPVTALVPIVGDQIVEVIAETIGRDAEQIKSEMTVDDVLGLTVLIWEECIAGPLGKARRLTSLVGDLVKDPTTKATELPS